MDEKNDIVDPSQCPSDRNCGPFTMTDLERKNDRHCAIGGEVLAKECVEHIFAAESTLPDVAIPTLCCQKTLLLKEKARLWCTMLSVIC